MGFSTKGNAKTLLLKYFTEDLEFTSFACAKALSGAPQNGCQRILLSLDAFEDFVIQVSTLPQDFVELAWSANLSKFSQTASAPISTPGLT